MKNRKGFTLIELMIVIAIIIILAAIAIPNYLRMTDRARRSRVAGDFTAIATALEAYSVDWGEYPVDANLEVFGKNDPNSHIEKELAGTGADPNEQNIPANKTLTGEDGGIEYIKLATILSMYNPFDPTDGYQYGSADGSHWILVVTYDADESLYRTDSTTDLTQVLTANLPAVP